MSSIGNFSDGDAIVSISTSERTRSGWARTYSCTTTPHRVAEQVEPVEALILDQLFEVGHQLLDGVRRSVTGVRTVAVSTMIEGDNFAIPGQPRHGLEPIEAAAGEAVHQHQRWRAGTHPDDMEIDVTHRRTVANWVCWYVCRREGARKTPSSGATSRPIQQHAYV